MQLDNRYKGIFYMLLAALGFSLMGGAAKLLKGSFGAGQLVFWRNLVGLTALVIGFMIRPPENKGGKFKLLIFRGIMGTAALYTLLYCILHIPLGTAMTYSLTSTLFIAVFSFVLFKEYHGRMVLLAVIIGFLGMLLIYKPAMHFPWYYHVTGLVSGITSAIAYMSVHRLAGHYDSRIIVLSFIGMGVLIPTIFMLARYIFNIPPDDMFFIDWKWPRGIEWLYVLWLGFAALFGQYFVTKAYGADKAGVVSAIGYANIIFSVFLGMALGDAFPDWMSSLGILCIITSGILISFFKHKAAQKMPKKLLFVCIENSNRSQMAEAFAKIIGGPDVEAYSSGSRPSGKINPKATRSMLELGYDLGSHHSKSLDEVKELAPFDVVVTMGCGDACPWMPAKKFVDWQIPDPREMNESEFREVRDMIAEKVRALLKEI